MTARLPAHVEVSGVVRAVQNAGGFAAVLSKGERDGGVVLLVTRERDSPARLWERMPQRDGSRPYACAREEDPAEPTAFAEYCQRRVTQDPDAWLVELEIADAARFVETMVT